MIIAGEQFVAAIARERDGHLTARELGDHERRERRHVPKRLVEGIQQPLRQADNVGPHFFRAMNRLVAMRNECRVWKLVVRPIREAERKRMNPVFTWRHTAHQRHDDARVDAAGQEGAQWNVGHQAARAAAPSPPRSALAALRRAASKIVASPDSPVDSRARASMFPPAVSSRRERSYAAWARTRRSESRRPPRGPSSLGPRGA